MSVLDLALTKGGGSSFDPLTLAKIKKQNERFNKGKTDYSNLLFLGLIPLSILAYVILKE